MCQNVRQKLEVKTLKRRIMNENGNTYRLCKLVNFPSSGGTLPENRFASRDLNESGAGKKNLIITPKKKKTKYITTP